MKNTFGFLGLSEKMSRNFIAILIVAFCGAIIYGLPYFRYDYYDVYLSTYHLTNTQMGIFGSVLGIFGMISYLFGGVVADKFTTRTIITVSMEAEPSQYKIISRGWMNAQNRSSIWSKDDITPGEFYDYSLEMIPTDHTIRRGSKLALIIYGTDAEETLRPKTVTNVTIDTASIDCEVPMKF